MKSFSEPFILRPVGTILLAIGLFLAINGKRLRADQVDAIQTILALAAGNLDEAGLAKWIDANLRSR